MFVVFIYITGTIKYNIWKSQHYFDIIREGINKYSIMDILVIIGDMNSRIGNKKEIIFDDTDNFSTHSLNYQYPVDLQIPKRYSLDIKSNKLGVELLNVCVSNKLGILNGRTLGNLCGQYTCFKHNGKSIFVNCLVTKQLFPDVISFNISCLN